MSRARLLAICVTIGIPTDPDRCPLSRPRWSGRSLSTRLLSPADLAHEVGHKPVAARRRVPLPDYGLGPSASDGGRAKRVVSMAAANREEALAAMMGVCIINAFRMGPERLAAMAASGMGAGAEYAPTIAALNRRGLLRGAVPVCLLPPFAIE